MAVPLALSDDPNGLQARWPNSTLSTEGAPVQSRRAPCSQDLRRKDHGPFEVEALRAGRASARQTSRAGAVGEARSRRLCRRAWTRSRGRCSSRAVPRQPCCARVTSVPTPPPLLAAASRDVPARSPAGLQRLTVHLRRGPAARTVHQVCDEYRLVLVGKITTDSAWQGLGIHDPLAGTGHLALRSESATGCLFIRGRGLPGLHGTEVPLSTGRTIQSIQPKHSASRIASSRPIGWCTVPFLCQISHTPGDLS